MYFRPSSFPVLLLAALISGSIFPGCSVKEDRDSCPCLVRIHLADAWPLAGGELLLALWDREGTPVYRDTLSDREETVSLLLPRGPLRIGIYSRPEAVSRDGRIPIPEGEDCPEMCFEVAWADASGEVLDHHASLTKPFCRLCVEVEDSKGSFPFSLRFHGGVDGFAPDGTPSGGDFRFDAVRTPSGTYAVCIPRQKDASLLLDIADGDGPVRTFAIGEILAGLGYDWTLPLLPDRELGLDYARTRLSLPQAEATEFGPVEVVL